MPFSNANMEPKSIFSNMESFTTILASKQKGHAVWHSLLLNNDFMLNIFLKILSLDFDVCQIHLRLNLQSHEDFFFYVLFL